MFRSEGPGAWAFLDDPRYWLERTEQDGIQIEWLQRDLALAEARIDQLESKLIAAGAEPAYV